MLWILEEYGPFTKIVIASGQIVAMGAAIALGFRGRAKWEPSEEDVSRGPQKVAGLVAAVSIVLIWTTMTNTTDIPVLSWWTIRLLILTVMALLVYGFLISVFTYHVERAASPRRASRVNIIGGFWLASGVKRRLEESAVTLQDFLKGTAYNVDAVWPRMSRALAKQTFVVAYLMLTVCGTLALACAAILLGLQSSTP